MLRLGRASLQSLAAGVKRPSHGTTAVGILHIGLGAFHRAHQAVYTEEIIAAGATRWGIAALNLRSSTNVDRLVEQDCLFSFSERSGYSESFRIVGSIRAALLLNRDRDAVIALFSSKDVQVVTITVSEKGYIYDPVGECLDRSHIDLKHELNTGVFSTMPGVIVAGLEARRIAGAGPITLISCDNYLGNGTVLRRVIEDYSATRSAELTNWIAGNVSFPSTMVDSIVPPVGKEDIARISERLGVLDYAAVIGEPDRHWVIKDDFAGERPPWDDAGARFVDDIAPFEMMKLRLLNAPHSAACYLGYLAGFEFVHDAVSEPSLGAFLQDLIYQELLETVPADGARAYADRTLPRFQNRAICDRTSRVVADGSIKLPLRLLSAALERDRQGLPINNLALATAAWMKFVTGVADNGRKFAISDPKADILGEIAGGFSGEPDLLADRLMALPDVFAPELAERPRFRSAVKTHLGSLMRNGVLATLRAQQSDRAE